MGNVVPIDRADDKDTDRRAEDKSAGWRWLNWAWEQRLGNTTLKSVLVTLAGHANAQGECWPSVSRLCERSDAKVRSVQNALRELERRGLMVTIPRTGTSNLYRLTPAGDAPPQSMHPAETAEHSCNKCAPPPLEMHPSPAGHAPKLPVTSNEKPEEPVCAAEAANTRFSEFFEQYPRPGNRVETKAAYEAALAEGVSHYHLMAALKRYCVENSDNIEGGKLQYVKQSQAWLNERYFERYQRDATDRPVNPDEILEQRANAIRKGLEWAGRKYSAVQARQLVARGMVTEDQCAAVGLSL